MRMGLLIFLHWVRYISLREYLFHCFVHVPLSILLFHLLFSKLSPQGISLSTIADQYIYFVALNAFIAGIASWEIELLTNTAGFYVRSVNSVIASRALFVIGHAWPTLISFLVLFAFVGKPFVDMVTLFGIALSFSLSGIGMGYYFGFKTEKSINNFSAMIVWVLALGPGLFLKQHGIIWLNALFPGGLLRLSPSIELLKLAAYALLGVTFIFMGLRPRKKKLFCK